MATNTTTTTKPPWSDLPQDLLSNIAKCLETRTELLHFRATCNSWRSSIPLKTPPTLKLPFPIGPNPDLNPNRRGHFNLIESTIHSIEPITKISHPHKTTKTWLLKIEDSRTPGKLQLKEPVSRYAFENLSKNLPKLLNLLDYKVTDISNAYGLEFVESGQGPPLEFSEMKSVSIKKVVASSRLDRINDGHFAVIAIHTRGKLSVWRMGDEKWTSIDINREGVHFEDIVYHKGMFYALDFVGFLITVDCSSLKVTEVVPPMGTFGHGGRFNYLVKSKDDLYLIEKHELDVEQVGFVGELDEEQVGYVEESDSDGYPIQLNVFKLNEEKKEWVSVFDGLGDRVFFIGEDSSFSVSGRDFAGCKRNCIYFTDTYFSEANDDHPGFDTGIFDLEDDMAGPLSAFPGYSNIFWPPPTWIFKPKPSASRA